MAVVTTVNTNFELLTGKNLTRQSTLVSRVKEAIVCVAIGTCMYPACQTGYIVDLSLCGRFTTIIEARPENLVVGACCNTLLVSQYTPAMCDAAATGTLHLFETAASACAVPLSELAACSCAGISTTVKFHVTGF